MDGNGHDRSVFPWRGRVLTEADLPKWAVSEAHIVISYQRETRKY